MLYKQQYRPRCRQLTLLPDVVLPRLQVLVSLSTMAKRNLVAKLAKYGPQVLVFSLKIKIFNDHLAE